jgi:hypothetical protein
VIFSFEGLKDFKRGRGNQTIIRRKKSQGFKDFKNLALIPCFQ